MRELLTMARERLGPAAQGLKTREELRAALGLDAPTTATIAPEPQPPSVRAQVDEAPLVTRDFFVKRGP